MKGETHLVLGGEGLIGRALTSRLQQERVTAISLDLKVGFDLRKDDLRPYRGVDYVWFLAWDVGGAKYLEDPLRQHELLLNNTLICARVFDFLRATGLPFLFTTSQLAGPHSAYGITKTLGEFWAGHLGGKVARLWNVYGWEAPGPRSHVIPDLVVMGLQNRQIYLRTTGEERRQFLFVDDCVDALLHLRLTAQQYADITAPPWRSIGGVAREIGRQLDVPVQLGDDVGYDRIINPEQLLKDWAPRVSFEEGVSKVIEAARRAGFGGERRYGTK